MTERPWALSAGRLDQLREAGLDEGRVLHAILQTSLFGHFNRIADAVGVDADYPDLFGTPPIEPAVPPYEWPDRAFDAFRPAIALALHAGAVERLEIWRAHALDRGAPLSRHERAVLAHAVAVRLGDAPVEAVPPSTARDEALVDLADLVTRAPWRLGPEAFNPLRDLGFADDSDVFDAVATASFCTLWSRVRVALTALGAPADDG